MNCHEGDCRKNDYRVKQKYDQLKDEIQRQVDSYRAIDRFGPVRGPVYDRLKDRSSYNSTNNQEEHCETVDEGEQEQVHESCDRAIWNRPDDRAIDRSHDRVIDRYLKKPTLYSNERARRDEDEQVEESRDRSIWNRSDDRAINRSHDRAIDRSLKKSILYSNERARRDENAQVDESRDRSIWNRSDDRAINRSHDRAIDRSLKKPVLYLNERARRDEDEQVEKSRDRSIWNLSDDRAINRSHDRVIDRSLKKSILYLNERARRDEDTQVEESHDRSIWNRSDDRAINRSHDRAIDRSLKKSILYSNERARRDEDAQVDESRDRSIWNRSDDRAINRSHDRAIDRSLKKPILYLNERARRDEDTQMEGGDQAFWNRSGGRKDDRLLRRSVSYSKERSRREENELRTRSQNRVFINSFGDLEKGIKPKASTQINEPPFENVIEQTRPWKIRMYRVHSGSSIYEERSVASMDDAAPGVNTPRSAFATPNAAVSRTETAEARRPSRYRPNQEVRTTTREYRSEFGSHPIRSEAHSRRRRERSSEDPTRRDFGFDRPQQLVLEVGFGIEDRAYGYSEYETYYSGLNVGNDDSRHFDEQQLYQGYGGWDADERPVDYGIEESFPPCGGYDIENGYSFQDAGLNFSDREYPRYRSPSRERSRTFRPGPSFEPDPGSRIFSERFRDRTRPLSRSPEYAARLRYSVMKLEKYDGTTSLESFLAKYEVCASHNRWSNKECLAQLKCSLTGQAAQILRDMGSKEISNSLDLVKALMARYETANQCALYRTQLRYRRRGKNETLCELVQDIRRLVVTAYPGPMTETTESIAIDAFIEALGNVEFSLKVRERGPSNLDSAYKIAMRLEAFVQNPA